MHWLTLMLAGLISAAALIYVLAPLLRPGPATRLVDDDRLTDLIGRKDAVVRSIKELEFDYHVGKLNDEDFARLNERLRRQAIGLLQQIEKLAPATASLDEQLEAQIAALRKTQDGLAVAQRQPSSTSVDGASAEPVVQAGMPANGDVRDSLDGVASEPVAISTAKEEDRPARKPRFCTNCGQPLDEAHKFCAQCGTPVDAATETSR